MNWGELDANVIQYSMAYTPREVSFPRAGAWLVNGSGQSRHPTLGTSSSSNIRMRGGPPMPERALSMPAHVAATAADGTSVHESIVHSAAA